MAKYRCVRQLKRVGGSTYISWPKQALLDLRLFVGDWLTLELDTELHTLTFRPLFFRDIVPTLGPKANLSDMMPPAPSDPTPPADPVNPHLPICEVR